jgi:hypothetical protein
MDRRLFLTVTAAIGLLPASRALAAKGDLRGAAREAWIYTLPLIEMANTRSQHLSNGRANRLTHVRRLADPSRRIVTAPNNDTLYSGGWFDLTGGPVTLTVPNAGTRYLALQLLDMYTNTNACISLRTEADRIGQNGGTFTLIAPGQKSNGPNPIHMATPHGWIIGRVLTDGGDDLPAARAMQDRIILSGPDVPTPRPYAGRSDSAAAYLGSAARLLGSDSPPQRDNSSLRGFAEIGLRPDKAFPATPLSRVELAQIEAGVEDARRAVITSGKASRSSDYVNGWFYPPAGLGNFGDDFLLRAIVALVGLAANTPDEALYLHPQGDHGRLFTGDSLYRLRLPTPPPVNAFWSLTMYEATEEGQLFLTTNAINRYSIGDRTKGLRSNPDGSIDIWIGRSDPGNDRTANWLPAPASGPFSLTFRAYWPRQEFRDGRYRLPPVERL